MNCFAEISWDKRLISEAARCFSLIKGDTCPGILEAHPAWCWTTSTTSRSTCPQCFAELAGSQKPISFIPYCIATRWYIPPDENHQRLLRLLVQKTGLFAPQDLVIWPSEKNVGILDFSGLLDTKRTLWFANKLQIFNPFEYLLRL